VSRFRTTGWYQLRLDESGVFCEFRMRLGQYQGLRQIPHTSGQNPLMPNHSISAFTVGLNGKSVIPASQIAGLVNQGEIIVVEKCLQAIAYLEPVREATRSALHVVLGEERASLIMAKGFESIHEFVDLEELPEILNHCYEAFGALAKPFVTEIAKEILGAKQGVYFEEFPNIRFHVPFDIIVTKKEKFKDFFWNGKVTAHGPHHDSWYCCPTNAVNVWIALGKVHAENGLNIFPRVFGKRLRCTAEGKIVPGQYLGPRVCFDLQPGDAVIFRGEHLHSSTINSTGATRYVLSLRLTLDKPTFLGYSPYKEDYVWAAMDAGWWSRLREIWANGWRIVRKKAREIARRGKPIRYLVSAEEIEQCDDTAADFPACLSVQEVWVGGQSTLLFESEALGIGEIRPLTARTCIARPRTDVVIVFDRFCPHEGADLAGGCLEGERVYCPWHNLPVNLQDGKSPCRSLRSLNVHRYVPGHSVREWVAANRS